MLRRSITNTHLHNTKDDERWWGTLIMNGEMGISNSNAIENTHH